MANSTQYTDLVDNPQEYRSAPEQHGDPVYLNYIPNTLERGHRGDDTSEGWASLEYSTRLAQLCEAHGWQGALVGTGWGRPDTFTLSTALAAQTTSFKPLVAIRPGYWQPAHFASSAATLDRLSAGRLLINVVSGTDGQAAYGDAIVEQAQRYERTPEFIRLVRRLWTEESVDFRGEYYDARDATLDVRPHGFEDGRLPPLYFGGASAAAERVAAAEADVQLFWGEPLAGVAERIERLRALSDELERPHQPLQFGLRVTTLVRETSDQAWDDAHSKIEAMVAGEKQLGENWRIATGQRRLLDLAERGDVIDSCLYTAPGRYGAGGAGTTWLVGSADDVAQALARYHALGVTHFVLSDTPYLSETARLGDELLPRLSALCADAAAHGAQPATR